MRAAGQGLDPERAAPPFEHNPSAWSQRVSIALLALLASAIAAYMGAFRWGWIDSVWDPVFGSGSETVLRSAESEALSGIIGVPDAVLGSWAYLTEVVLAFAGSTRRWQFRPWLVVLFGIDVIPLGIVSAILVVVQGVAVGAWCFLCLVTAVISLGLVALAWDEVWASLRYLREVWRREPGGAALWRTFTGRPTPSAVRVAFELTG
ncbi:MAG TPA: vitamin K epoxide reductase family protein [Longimicrobiales bacterium]|nr:vitamin K epoxide reductase family protein [Longimicrobiales bacterium]